MCFGIAWQTSVQRLSPVIHCLLFCDSLRFLAPPGDIKSAEGLVQTVDGKIFIQYCENQPSLQSTTLGAPVSGLFPTHFLWMVYVQRFFRVSPDKALSFTCQIECTPLALLALPSETLRVANFRTVKLYITFFSRCYALLNFTAASGHSHCAICVYIYIHTYT